MEPITIPANFTNIQTNKETVQLVFPDAHVKKWAKLSICIWSTFCGRQSGFFHTEEEAWADAVTWLNKSKR